MDRNGYYGDSVASLNLTRMWEKYMPNQKVPEELGHNRDWNIDQTPKFVLSDGKLVNMIIKTGVK